MAVSCGVGRRCGSDPVLLWLWHRPAAVTPTGPLAWEPPCAVSVALKSKKNEKIKLVSFLMMMDYGIISITLPDANGQKKYPSMD